MEDLEAATGIRYLAPRDARDTGLAPGSFDLISSTFTLEHIPERDIADILAESARLLTEDGLIRCSIDMKDHYSYFDGSLSHYNFLRFTDRQWKLLNPPLHFQNRLRYQDYIALFEGARLAILDERTVGPTAGEKLQLASMRLAPPFSERDLEQVAVLELTILAGHARRESRLPPGGSSSTERLQAGS